MKSDSVEVTQLPGLPARAPEAHKGDFGRILVVAGSTGLAGAGAMTALAALRSGAGLVTMLVPGRIYEIAASWCPCIMTHPSKACMDYFTPEALKEVTQLLGGATVLVLGPGLGRLEETGGFVRELVKQISEIPLVLDADGLYGVRGRLEQIAQRKAATVLTPHPGELSYLMGNSIADIQADRVGAATRLANAAKGIGVLKGHRTVVSNGTRYYVNPTGNAGMATAGSGDVLTGIIAGLMGQGMEAFAAACLGTCVHGLAGDLAAEELGQESLIATDLIEYLSAAMKSRARHDYTEGKPGFGGGAGKV